MRSLARDGVGGRLTFLAGLVDGRLAGYLGGWAVDGTAYFQRLHIRTEALSTQVGTALVFAFVEACQRGGDVREVVNGLHSPEDERPDGLQGRASGFLCGATRPASGSCRACSPSCAVSGRTSRTA